MPEASHWKPALLVFLVAGVLLWFRVSSHLLLNIDEGIYLDGALRAYNGETLYRDFLAHTGPGTFWLCQIAFRLLGVSLSHARIPLVLGLASIAAGVFYLTAALTARGFAWGVAVLFLLIETSDQYLIAVNHRWDSGAFGFLAVVLAFCAMRCDSRLLAFGAGICAAAAAWVTPTVGVIALPLTGWMLFQKSSRRLLVYLAGGGALLSAVCAAILAAQGALQPMVHHFLWTGSNYGAPNRVPYGFAGTGLGDVGAGLGPAAKILFSIALGWVFLPAILPVLAYCGWAAWFAFRRTAELVPAAARQAKPPAPPGLGGSHLLTDARAIVFLLVCSLALFASTYPRWDRGHLLYVTPIFYVLVAALAYRVTPRRALAPVFVVLLLLLRILGRHPLLEADQFATLETPSGKLAVLPKDRDFVESLLRHVHPGDSLFVFPNFPTVYFLTRGKNPSRFSFLQAGLMTDQDEQAAIQDLQAKPPQWVVYWDVPVSRYLKTSPSADPARLRFPRMEEYLKENYRAVETHDHWHGPYSVLERAAPPR